MTNASSIVSVVRKGWGSTVLEASVKAGARGGTVLFGRGAELNDTGRGIAFVVPVDRIVGVAHFMRQPHDG
jgi:nitrogen regulatory protein P-II 1